LAPAAVFLNPPNIDKGRAAGGPQMVLTTVKDNRPVNLDMMTIALPLPGWVSILTRASGVFLFVGMAFFLYVLDLSLESPEGFAQAGALLSAPLAKFILWAIAAGLIYHATAGIKHLVADFGIGETLEGGLMGARITIGVSAFLIIIVGIWIW
jgi:succinate dehydrogenase / fumarate reductase cytochrome b subunit